MIENNFFVQIQNLYITPFKYSAIAAGFELEIFENLQEEKKTEEIASLLNLDKYVLEIYLRSLATINIFEKKKMIYSFFPIMQKSSFSKMAPTFKA